MTRWMAATAVLSSVFAGACGYHLAGKASVIPANVKVIAIPAFSNGTVRYRLADVLTADVVREFHSRTKYTIVSDPAHADAVLSGVVTNFAVLGGITTDQPPPTGTGRATSSQIILTLQLRLTDAHTGKVLFAKSGYEFRERYEIATDLTTYFDESSTAIKRVSEDAARSVVSIILEAF